MIEKIEKDKRDSVDDFREAQSLLSTFKGRNTQEVKEILTYALSQLNNYSAIKIPDSSLTP